MKWLFLVHQVHTPKSRERVKVWRAIKKTGAVLYRNSVYVLPYNKERLEDFQWVSQQINDAKGEASVFVTDSQNPKEDRTLQALFNKERASEYAGVLSSAERLRHRLVLLKRRDELSTGLLKSLEKEAQQLRQELADIRKVDFFSDLPPRKLTRVIEEISIRLSSGPGRSALNAPPKSYSMGDFRKKIWATREDIHVDRLSSAWLIRRFIDPQAKFVFEPEDSLPKNAIPFDVVGAEFSHHGEDCTFETLIKAFRIQDPAARQIAEIIHDIDLKDQKFGRTEAHGVDTVIRSLSESLQNDERLLEEGCLLLDALYEYYAKRRRR